MQIWFYLTAGSWPTLYTMKGWRGSPSYPKISDNMKKAEIRTAINNGWGFMVSP